MAVVRSLEKAGPPFKPSETGNHTRKAWGRYQRVFLTITCNYLIVSHFPKYKQQPLRDVFLIENSFDKQHPNILPKNQRREKNAGGVLFYN